jgi:phosphoglycerol transferase MdoB-like AlkP superfamily enzyme
MKTWIIFASIASILSLIFHLSGKGSYLRQFTLPATMALVGFTVGMHESKVEEASNLIQQDPHLLFMLVLILLLFGLTMYLVESTRPDAKVSFIFLIFLATVAIPQLIKTYDDIAPMVATQDYLALARVKETSGNTDEAIRYLKIYSKRIDRVELQKQVAERIESLRKQQFKRDSATKSKLPN